MTSSRRESDYKKVNDLLSVTECVVVSLRLELKISNILLFARSNLTERQASIEYALIFVLPTIVRSYVVNSNSVLPLKESPQYYGIYILKWWQINNQICLSTQRFWLWFHLTDIYFSFPFSSSARGNQFASLNYSTCDSGLWKKAVVSPEDCSPRRPDSGLCFPLDTSSMEKGK